MWWAARAALGWLFGDDAVKLTLAFFAGMVILGFSATCSAVRSIESQPYGQYWLAGGPSNAPQAQPIAAQVPPPVDVLTLPLQPLAPVPTPRPLPALPVATERLTVLVANAMQWLGTRYLWGGCTRQGVDCSCFVRNAFATIGVSLPRTTTEQIRIGAPVEASQAAGGDLVFFDNTCVNCGANPTHVGLYLGDGRMIDAGDPVRVEVVYSGHNARYRRVM